MCRFCERIEDGEHSQSLVHDMQGEIHILKSKLNTAILRNTDLQNEICRATKLKEQAENCNQHALKQAILYSNVDSKLKLMNQNLRNELNKQTTRIKALENQNTMLQSLVQRTQTQGTQLNQTLHDSSQQLLYLKAALDVSQTLQQATVHQSMNKFVDNIQDQETSKKQRKRPKSAQFMIGREMMTDEVHRYHNRLQRKYHKLSMQHVLIYDKDWNKKNDHQALDDYNHELENMVLRPETRTVNVDEIKSELT